jgi:hypothetical protein
MAYDFSFDKKSIAALLIGSVALCALLFFAGVLVGVGWDDAEPSTRTAAQKTPPESGEPPAQPVVAAEPAGLASPPQQASAPPTEPVLYDDPERQQYAAQGYGARPYGPQGYAAQGYAGQGYAGQDYAAQRYVAPDAGAARLPPQSASAAAPPADVRREAERLSNHSISPDPRLISEAGDEPGGGGEPRGAASAYSVQVGTYLSESDARRLVAELENKGYTPTVFSGLDAEARKWYAVRIGAYPNAREAGMAAGNFVKQEKLKAAVRPAGSL